MNKYNIMINKYYQVKKDFFNQPLHKINIEVIRCGTSSTSVTKVRFKADCSFDLRLED